MRQSHPRAQVRREGQAMIIKLPGYGVNGTAFHLVVEKMTHFYGISYNGRHGTCIVLEGGKEMITELMPYEVEKKIDDMRLILSEQNR